MTVTIPDAPGAWEGWTAADAHRFVDELIRTGVTPERLRQVVAERFAADIMERRRDRIDAFTLILADLDERRGS